MLAASRCMVLLTRVLISLPSSVVELILDSLLIYLWSHVEHYMDAARHLATSALLNLQSIAKSYPGK